MTAAAEEAESMALALGGNRAAGAVWPFWCFTERTEPTATRQLLCRAET